MSLKLLFASLLFLISNEINNDHPLKMSFSNLSVKVDGQVELETRIFLDDLSLHMQNKYDLESVDFSEVNSNGTQVFQNYIKEHFYFQQDSQKVVLLIDSVSLSNNNMALVLNIKTSQALDLTKEISLTNTVLCDGFKKQINDIKYLGKHYQLSTSFPTVTLPSISSF